MALPLEFRAYGSIRADSGDRGRPEVCGGPLPSQPLPAPVASWRGSGLLRWVILQLGLEVRREVPCLETIPLPQGLTIALLPCSLGPCKVVDKASPGSLQITPVPDHSRSLQTTPPSSSECPAQESE